MPPYANVTIYYLKDIISGKKKCKSKFEVTAHVDVNNANVTNVNVPHYKTLSLKEIAQWVRAHPAIYDYLPDL